MASMISLTSVLLLMLLALGPTRVTSLGSSMEQVEGHEINTLGADNQLEDPNVDIAGADVVDTSEIEQGNYVYEEEQSDSGREKRVVKRCGPDVTRWLIRQSNTNINHRQIINCRSWYNSLLWPRCVLKFAALVGNCRPWDFKCTQSFTRGGCPSQCPRTVTLCGRCVNYDVPGNIHYGWVGRAASFRRWVLLYAADRVQKGGVDDPADQNAIKIGMDLWDVPSKRSGFCREVLSRISSLNLQGTKGCSRCTTSY